MTVIAWGGDGASGGRLTWPLPGEAASKGSPAATDERCVLDEHIALRPMPEGKEYQGGAERTRTEIAGGARKPRYVLIIERLGPVPRFPTTFDSHPELVEG